MPAIFNSPKLTLGWGWDKCHDIWAKIVGHRCFWLFGLELWMKESQFVCEHSTIHSNVRVHTSMRFAMSIAGSWGHAKPVKPNVPFGIRIHLDLETWFGLWLRLRLWLCAEAFRGIETMLLKPDVTNRRCVQVFRPNLQFVIANIYARIWHICEPAAASWDHQRVSSERLRYCCITLIYV